MEIFSFENYYSRGVAGYFKAVGLEGDQYDLEGAIEFSEQADEMFDLIKKAQQLTLLGFFVFKVLRYYILTVDASCHNLAKLPGYV